MRDGGHTEEDTSKRGKGAEKVGLPCNRGLGHVDVGSRSQRFGAGHLIVQLLVVVHVGGGAEKVHSAEQ